MTSGLWEVRRVKEMRVVDGKREWLVAWSGVDGTGKQRADTWQPTRSLTPDLKHNFFSAVLNVPSRSSRSTRGLLTRWCSARSRSP